MIQFTASHSSLGFFEFSALHNNDPLVVFIDFLYLTFDFWQSASLLLSISLAFFRLRKCSRYFFAVTSYGSFINSAGRRANLTFLMRAWSAMQSVISLLSIAI